MLNKLATGLLLLLILFAQSAAFAVEPDARAKNIRTAFDVRSFLGQENFALSPNAKWIAYCIVQKPSYAILNTKYRMNGTPSAALGSQIYLTRLDNTDTIAIGPAKGNNWGPSWSPDNQKIAFYSDAGGYPQVWLYDLSTQVCKTLCQEALNTGLYPQDALQWSPDGQTLYAAFRSENDLPGTLPPLCQKDDAYENRPSVKVYSSKSIEPNPRNDYESLPDIIQKSIHFRLASIDIATGSLQTIVIAKTTPSLAAFKISPTGKYMGIISLHTEPESLLPTGYSLAVIELGHAKTEATIATGLMKNGLQDDFFIWHPTRDELAYIKGNAAYLADLNTPEHSTPSKLYESQDGGPIGKPFAFTRDGKNILLGKGSEIYNYQPKPLSFVAVDLGGGLLLDSPFGDQYRYLSLLETQPGTAWQPDGPHATFCLENIHTHETAILQYPLDREANPKPKILWQKIAKLSHFACQNESKALFTCYEDLESPPNLYKLNLNMGELHCLTNIDPRLNTFTHPVKAVFETVIPIYNGELKKVKTTVLLPEGTKPGDLVPALVMIYPGSNLSSEIQAFCGGNQVTIPNSIFLNNGYAIVLPDIPLGPEGEPGNPLLETVDALLPQIHRAADLGYIDIQRLGLIGQSYGGYGVGGVLCSSNLFTAAAAISGAYDLIGGYGELDEWYQNWCEHGQGRMGHNPWEDMQRYINNSPYYLADKIHTPLLLIHGESDYNCPVQESQKLFVALKQLKREVQLALYPGQGHFVNEWSRPNAVDATERILDFFDKHLK